MTNLDQTPEEYIKNIPLFTGDVVNPLSKPDIHLDAPPPPNFTPSIYTKGLGNSSTAEPGSPEEFVDKAIDYIGDAPSYGKDLYKYGRTYSYDADVTGANFQRYYNVPRVFNKLGFSPFRDNEALYKSEMTWWDDYKRSLGQTASLAGIGFTSMLPWNAWNPDATDEHSALEMKRANMIGASSKDNLGGWFNDLSLNAGYTLGIGAEFAMEEGIMWGLTALVTAETGGAGAGTVPITAARTWNLGSKLVESLGTLGKVGKSMGKSFKRLYELKDVNKAREFFKASQLGKNAAKFGKSILPHTFQAGEELTKDLKAGKSLSTLAKVRPFGAFYRDSREVAAALSESKMEGGMAEDDMYNDLYNKYRSENGKSPDKNTIIKMREYASKAGVETFWRNMPALYLSNRIVFGKSFKGLPGAKEIRMEFQKGLTGEVTIDAALKKAGKQIAFKTEKSFKNTLSSLKKPETWYPKNLYRTMVKKTTAYGRANLTEGLQENYQDATSEAMKNYYTQLYNDPSRASMYSSWGPLMTSLEKQLTTKVGFSTFASGFLMGGLVQLPQTIIYEKAPGLIYKLSDPKGYQEAVSQRDKTINDLVNAINYIADNPTRVNEANLEGLIKAKIQNNYSNEVEKTGDDKSVKDSEDDAMIQHLNTLLNSGHLDATLETLSDMKELSGPELEEAYGKVPEGTDPKKYYTDQIDGVIRKARSLKKTAEEVSAHHVNPYNPTKYSPFTQPALFVQEKLAYEAFENSKMMAIYARESYTRTAERMAKIAEDMSTNKILEKASSIDFSNMFTPAALKNERDMLKKEIPAFKEGTGDDKKIANKKTKRLEAIEGLLDGIEDYRITLKSVKENLLGEFTSEEKEAILTKSLTKLHDGYKGYVNMLANDSGDIIFDSKLEDGFRKLADFYHIKSDMTDFAESVNMLHNPYYFNLMVDRHQKLGNVLNQNRQKYFRESVEKMDKTNLFNSLLNELINLDVHLSEEDLNKFLKGTWPGVFYKNDGTIVRPGTELYDKIETVFENFEKLNNIVISDRPIAGAKEPDTVFSHKVRDKFENDTRTYSQLAEQFGFDSKLPESQVKAGEVLQDIVNSPYANRREKKLAEALSKAISPELNITFSKVHATPGSYTKTKGIVVDARYSSHDYKAGFNVLEVVMLHEIMHQLTSEGLESDKEFSAAITNLLEVARESHKRDKQPYGLKNEYEFISEAFTNEDFQKYLQGIEYVNTGKTLWEEFMGAIINFFKVVLKVDTMDNNLLNEVVYIVTSKINKERGVSEIEQAKTEPQPQAETGPLVFDQLGKLESDPTDPALMTLTVKTNKGDIKFGLSTHDLGSIVYEATQDGKNIFSDIWTGIKNAQQLKDVIESQGLEISGVTAKEEPLSYKSDTIISKLLNLGYSKDEINIMPDSVAEMIISEKIKKQEVADIEQEKQRVNIDKQFDVKSVTELDEAYQKLQEEIIKNPLTIDEEYLDKAYQNKKAKLMDGKYFTKEDLKVGLPVEYLVDGTSQFGMITKIDKGQVIISDDLAVPNELINVIIKTIHKEGAISSEEKPEFTEQEKANSDKNMQADDASLINEAENLGKGKTSTQLEDELNFEC